MSEGHKKMTFIVNPISGGGKGIRIKKILESSDLSNTHDVVIHTTTVIGEAFEVTKKAVENQTDIVVAVGGDGTVNEIGSALIGSNTIMGIIPAGSGNGLANHLDIPSNIQKAIELLKRNTVKDIDTGTMNNRPFMNVAGTGLDAQISRKFAQSKKRGWFNYFKIMLLTGTNIIESNFHIKYNGTERTVNAYMITAANSTQFGNNARIAPHANIEDGKIDICIMKGTGLLRSALSLYKLMTGSLKNGKYYETFQTDEIEIGNTDGWGHVDGEPCKLDGTIHINVNPKSLKVIC